MVCLQLELVILIFDKEYLKGREALKNKMQSILDKNLNKRIMTF